MNLKTIMRIKLILISSLLASCSYLSVPLLAPYKMDVRQGNYITAEMREKLKLGMSKQQVRYVLGTPMISDVLHANRWDYPFRLEQEGKLVEKQLLSLYFDGNNLSKIDDGKAVEVAVVKPVLAAESAPPEVVTAAQVPAATQLPVASPVPVVAPTPLVAPAIVAALSPMAAPAVALQPKPAAALQPKPAAALQPKPAVALQPKTATALQTKPAVVLQPKAAVHTDGEAEVLKAVQAWAAAWQARDASTYLAAYAPDFKPEGMSHGDWEKQRSSRIVKALKVVLSDINVNVVDANHAKILFTQSYSAEGYHDQVEKMLQLVRQAGVWLIVEERAGKTTKANALTQTYVPAEPATTSVAPPTSADQQAVQDAVNHWVDAWSARDVEKYLASYSSAFKPTGLSKPVWDTQRKSRISKARSIVVELSALKIKLHDERHASATFMQVYRSDTYHDSQRKTLLLEKVNDAWLIQAEQVAK